MPECRVLQNKAYRITSAFGARTVSGVRVYHSGADIIADDKVTTDDIIAHSAGTVVWVQRFDRTDHSTAGTDRSYGNAVKIQHANGYYTLYGHMANIDPAVKVNEGIAKGQRLGYMGNTGNSYGAHLHFEVRKPTGRYADAIDPAPYVKTDLPGLPTNGDANGVPSMIAVDGFWGAATTKKAQHVFKTAVDGIVSNQPQENLIYLSAAYQGTWQFKPLAQAAGGSQLIKKIQQRIGTAPDGYFGKASVMAFQKFLGITQDGSMGPATVKAFQQWLNKQ